MLMLINYAYKSNLMLINYETFSNCQKPEHYLIYLLFKYNREMKLCLFTCLLEMLLIKIFDISSSLCSHVSLFGFSPPAPLLYLLHPKSSPSGNSAHFAFRINLDSSHLVFLLLLPRDRAIVISTWMNVTRSLSSLPPLIILIITTLLFLWQHRSDHVTLLLTTILVRHFILFRIKFYGDLGRDTWSASMCEPRSCLPSATCLHKGRIKTAWACWVSVQRTQRERWGLERLKKKPDGESESPKTDHVCVITLRAARRNDSMVFGLPVLSYSHGLVSVTIV